MTLHSQIDWRYAEVSELRACCPGDGGRWLGPREHRQYGQLRDRRRREGWLLARVLAKRLLLEHFDDVADARAIEIIFRDARNKATRPLATIDGRTLPCSLSISHTATALLAAICMAPGTSIGVDLVQIERLRPAFVRTWFHGDEQALIATEASGEPDSLAVCTLWAVKEAAYKAANRGDGFAPRQICIRRLPSGGYTCTYRGADLSNDCRIRAWIAGNHVAALATASSKAAPFAAVEPAVAAVAVAAGITGDRVNVDNSEIQLP